MPGSEASRHDFHDRAGVRAVPIAPCSSCEVRPEERYREHHVEGKIPVVLQLITVHIDVLADITLEKPSIEIKRVKNRLKLTQCQLLTPTGKLFLKGFVRQNIEYAVAPTVVTPKTACGDLADCIVDIPFECVTHIRRFINQPQFEGFNFEGEFEYFKSSRLPRTKFPEKERMLAGDLSEFNQHTHEHFTELPYCELLDSEVTQFLEFIDREPIPNAPFEEGIFTQIEEKMDIEITLKILQNQEVFVPRSTIRPPRRGRRRAAWAESTML